MPPFSGGADSAEKPLMININVLIILGSGHMKDWSGLVGSAFTSPNGLVEKKVVSRPV